MRVLLISSACPMPTILATTRFVSQGGYCAHSVVTSEDREVRMSDPRIAGWHRPIHERYRDVGAFRTRTLELDGAGTPLILLHGYSDQADTWRPLLRALQHTDRAVIAVDLPGFGRASDLEPGPILDQLDAFVAELASEVAARHDCPAVLIGNSLGGCLAMRAAARGDLPVAAVVPISPAGFGHSRAIKFADRPGGLASLLRYGVLPMPLMRSIMSAGFRGAACPNPRHADKAAVKAWAGQFRNRNDVIRILGTANQMLDELHSAPRDVPIDVPILLLWGDRDRLTLHSGARHICQANPHTEFVPLHGHGHCPQLEIAPRLAALIADFVDRCTVATAPRLAPLVS
jgi:pimeloyl-ACP methyl ester carboxylesterase